MANSEEDDETIESLQQTLKFMAAGIDALLAHLKNNGERTDTFTSNVFAINYYYLVLENVADEVSFVCSCSHI